MPFRRSGSGALTAHAIDVEGAERVWPLDNGRVCLDLVATIGERWGRRFERLRSPADLHRWLHEVGLVCDRKPDPEELEEVRRLRAAVYSCVEAAVDGDRLPARARRRLNSFAAAPEPAPQLTAAGSRVHISDDVLTGALSVIARDAITLISGPDLARVRECAAADCARVFLDRSRPGSRRWCSMQTCGNRAKARHHRARVSGGETR